MNAPSINIQQQFAPSAPVAPVAPAAPVHKIYQVLEVPYKQTCNFFRKAVKASGYALGAFALYRLSKNMVNQAVNSANSIAVGNSFSANAINLIDTGIYSAGALGSVYGYLKLGTRGFETMFGELADWWNKL